MSQETNFVAPQGEMVANFTAPSNFETKVKREGIEMLNHGSNLGVIQGIIDMGSHMESYDNSTPELKRKIKIIFEHPQLKQLYYEDDTTPRSAISSFEKTYSLHEKSQIRKMVHAVEGRVLPDKEAYDYNIARLLGAMVNVQIEHTPGKKDPTKIYEKVTGVFSAKGLAVPVPFEPENPKYLFFIDPQGNNFLTKNFADLPFYVRKKIMESQEAKDHAAKGGKFAEHPRTDAQQPQGVAQQQAPQQPQAPMSNVPSTPNAKKVVLNDPAVPLQNWYANGWDDEMIVANGHGKWEVVAPAPPVAPQAPQAPSAPQAPVAQQPQQVQAPQSEGSGLFNGKEEDDLPF